MYSHNLNHEKFDIRSARLRSSAVLAAHRLLKRLRGDSCYQSRVVASFYECSNHAPAHISKTEISGNEKEVLHDGMRYTITMTGYLRA
jgi:hypothetical protein